MRHQLSAILAAIICLVFAPTPNGQAGQGHPDFSGAWTVDADKTAAASGQPGRKYPNLDTTIIQDAKTLTAISGRGSRFVYQLDGSEVRIHAFSDTPDVVYKSTWQGAKIVTTFTGDTSIDTKIKETRSMEGQWMVIETVRKSATGETTGKLYYAKVPKK